MKMIRVLVLICCFFTVHETYSQFTPEVLKGIRNKRTTGRGADTTLRKNNNKLDTLGFEHRDDLRDSVAISFRYLDSTRRQLIDSSVNDFDRYYSVPSYYQYLGNNGAAAFPLIFRPFLKTGWDAGFHAFDIYRYTLADTKIYRTTGPFSLIGYQLASGQEQMIQALHTQSPRPNMNFGIDYKLISAPGLFVTQNTNHNSIRLWGDYRGKKKRYAATFILVSNNIKASQNGGITADSLLLDENRKERFTVPVRLGAAQPFAPNPFKSSVETGILNKDRNIMLRQSYDFGKRDSVAVNDSTTEYLFYPQLRVQHTVTAGSYAYEFRDSRPDSAYYASRYNYQLPNRFAAFNLQENWNTITNDFSLISFPDIKNNSEFISAGVNLENIKRDSGFQNVALYNLSLHGEYRNRTRNRLWELMAKGELYAAGLNNGDYNAYGSLRRNINKRFGDVSIYFSNVNRRPSFIFDDRSNFKLGPALNLRKENIIAFGAVSANPFITLSFNNFLINNYTYFYDYYRARQNSSPVNILQFIAAKKFSLSKRIKLYVDAAVQQTDKDGPIRLPFLYTRGRLAYEGSFFKNLSLSAGIEMRYFTPYKAWDFSPVNAQFVPQDSITISNLPDIHAFFHFRIKGFTGFLRAENLNTLSFRNGVGFINNNFSAPHYPSQGQAIRFGIRWWFVY